MPGIYWLPTTGSAVGTGAAAADGHDFYDLELEVTVPHGWLVAGPGARRDGAPGDRRSIFHFKPARRCPPQR